MYPEHIYRAAARHYDEIDEHEAYLERQAERAAERIAQLYHETADDPDYAELQDFEEAADEVAREVFKGDPYDLSELLAEALPRNHRF